MVKVTKHPMLPLFIYNYTQRAQFTPEHWNHVTDLCRGLVVDSLGYIVARGFKKFWNINDARHPETMMENLPATPPTLTTKLDGSLGIAFRYYSEWHVATRGSFDSPQAIWATAWLRANVPDLTAPLNTTLLFEIVYPANQIVVKYDWSGLVLLAAIDNNSGCELRYTYLKKYAQAQGLSIVTQHAKPLTEAITEDIDNEEGYVATWLNAAGPPLKVKIKYATYCRLHRMLTQTSPLTVWEALRDNLDLDKLSADSPAEFQTWVGSVIRDLRGKYAAIEQAALDAYLTYKPDPNLPEDVAAYKKHFAEYAKSQPANITHLLFALQSQKDLAPQIWKQIRPTQQYVFKTDIDT